MQSAPAAPETGRPHHRAVLVSLAAFGLICLLQIVKAAPFPQSDLMRDVVAYAWSFDYSKLYAFSPDLPRFDPYIGFDWLWGLVTRCTSPVVSAHVAQIVDTLLYLSVMLCSLRETTFRVYRSALALFLILGTLATGRLVDGRPEVVATIWLLSAASLRPSIWAMLGIALAPFYWLLPVYAVGACLLRTSWAGRICTMAAAALGISGFWLGYGGLDWLRHVRAVPAMAAYRVVPVPEAAPVTSLFHHPGTWLVLACVAVTLCCNWKQLRETGWWWAIGLFLLVGTVRHVLVLAPLMTLWCLRQPWRTPGVAAPYGLFLVAIVSGVLAMLQLFPGDGIPRFIVPPGSVVLAGYNQGVFSLPFDNPGRVMVAPGIEAAWDGPETRMLAASVNSGSLTCRQLAGLPFNFVLGSTHHPVRGACFRQVSTQGRWVLWQIAEPNAAAG